MAFRAKVYIVDAQAVVTLHRERGKWVQFAAVYADRPNEDGNACPENRIFGDWTPHADFQMTIFQPAVCAQLQKGREFYVDFTEVRRSDGIGEVE